MSACPSISWTARRSAPPSSRWVANECRSVCGDTCFSIPARVTYFCRIFQAPMRVSGWPRAFRNRRRALPLLESRSQLPHVRCECPNGPPADRDEPLLASLSEDADQALVEHDVAHADRDPFRHAQPGSVRQLEQSPGRETRADHRALATRAVDRSPRRSAPRAAFSSASGDSSRSLGSCATWPSPSRNLKYVRSDETLRRIDAGASPRSFR